MATLSVQKLSISCWTKLLVKTRKEQAVNFSRLATEDTVMINALRWLERHGKTPEVAVEKMVQLNKHTSRM